MSAVVFPFGKHAGQKLSQIPAGYLRWFVGVARDSQVPGVQAIRGAVLEELERRREQQRRARDARLKPNERIDRDFSKDPMGWR